MARRQPKQAKGKSAPTRVVADPKKKTTEKPAAKKPEPTAAAEGQRRSSRAATAPTKKVAGSSTEKPKTAPLACSKNLRGKKSREPDLKKYTKLVAKLPAYRDKNLADESDRDEPIWVNPPNYFDKPENVTAVHDYVSDANAHLGVGIDRALYNLLKKNYDIPAATEAVNRMTITRPIPWTEQDCEIFRRCFAAYGKNFMKIQEIMDHKTKREVIAHYYNTKSEEKYKSSANNIHPDEVDFGDSDDDGDVRKGNCLLCSRERTLYNCTGDLICNSCRIFKDSMEDFDEEVELYDLADDKGPRAQNPCPLGWEEIIHEAVSERLHDPISREKFEELKEQERQRITAQVEALNAAGGTDSLEEVMRVMPKQYGFFFLKFDEPPSKCETETQVLKIQTNEKILRIRQKEAELEKDMDELGPLMERIDAERVAYNKKMKSEPKPPRVRYSAQWSDQEMTFAYCAFLRYGLDFKAVSAIVRTKSADMCKVFYDKHKHEIGAVIQKREKDLNKGITELVAKMQKNTL